MSRVVAFRNGADYKNVEVDEPGYPVYGSGGRFKWASAWLHDGPSVLFGRKGTVDRPLYVDGKFWTVDTMYYTVPNAKLIDAKFLFYWATQIPFGYYSTDTALPSMTQSDLGSEPIALPPLNEQRQIADYLDHETAEIDAFIADLNLLSQLLIERGNAEADSLFSRFVESAETSPLRRKLVEIDERAGSVGRPEDLLSVSIRDGVYRWSDRTSDLPRAEDLTRYKRVREGDLVLNRMRAFQGGIGVSRWKGVTSPDYAVLRTGHGLLATFATELIRSRRFQYEIRKSLRGIGTHDSGQVRTPRISIADLIRIPVDLPSLGGQAACVNRWESYRSNLDDRLADAALATELAKERRAALISAAVSGQIDMTAKHKPVAEQLEDELAGAR